MFQWISIKLASERAERVGETKINIHVQFFFVKIFLLYYSGHFNVHRAFATETTQFLAPYEASVKPRADDTTPPELPSDIRPCIATSASHVRVVST